MIFLFIFSINVASATDMNDNSFYNSVFEDKEDDISVSVDNEGSLTELYNYIDSQIQKENYTISLNKSYTFSEGDEDLIKGIIVSYETFLNNNL